jgi:lysophospholipase L1-like esterase
VITKQILRRRTARLTGVLAAVALTAGFAAAPAGADPTPSGQTPIYLGLGDSYAAGTGGGTHIPNPFTAPVDCRQTYAAYPTQLRGINLGCFGANTGDVSSAVTWAALDPATKPYIENASVITVTVGGNDIDTGAVAANCVTSTATTACKAALFNSLALKLPKLPGKIKSMLAVIKKKAPRAKIVLTGYPRLFTVNPLMTTEQKSAATTLNAAADLLNGTIALSALANRVKYVSVTDRFINHGVGSAEPWIVGPQPFCAMSTPETCADSQQPVDVFHPTATGYTQGYVAALTGAVAR